jgi:hypothetical protein
MTPEHHDCAPHREAAVRCVYNPDGSRWFGRFGLFLGNTTGCDKGIEEVLRPVITTVVDDDEFETPFRRQFLDENRIDRASDQLPAVPHGDYYRHYL